MGIKVNSVKGHLKNQKIVAKSATDAYNKSSKAKVQEVVVEDVIEAQDTDVVDDCENDACCDPESIDEIKVLLATLTKTGLEDYAREHCSLELDKRKSKSDLVSEILECYNK
tara:strand:- start:8141 stop:8476 length:336 start_codon:yes stop_codon:yes gene_type:complete